MATNYHISDSAFLVNESRARKTDISKDIYAHYWLSDDTRQLWDDFALKVYPDDDLVISVRNRYFLESLTQFVDNHHQPVFVNIAAGLTSYPFLLKNPCDCLEIDYQHLVSFKQENLRTWQNQGKLPLRNLDFFAADLHNPDDLDRVKQTLKSTIQERPSYILMEGITYYLDLTVIQQILDILGQYQTSGSIFACDFWTPDMINNPAFLKLETYFIERFGYGTNHYTFLEPTWFNSLKSYQLLELTDVVEQEKHYHSTNILEQHQPLILRENYAILTKI